MIHSDSFDSRQQRRARPRRSVLYVAGANARALQKARGLPADAVILDLEDAVAPQAKAQAREQVMQALQGDWGGRERIVRVNGWHTPWGPDDLAAVARAGADAVLLPKVQDAAQLAQAAGALDAAGGPAGLPLWAMIETPLAILRLDAIAGGHPRLECLVMGTSDLVKDMQARHTPDRLACLAALSLTVMAARAHGLAALDGVHLVLQDQAGLAAACRQGRDLGFDGKTVIHPAQIAAANAAFGPTEPELAQARKQLAAWQAGAGQGVVVVDGVLVEHLHVQEARRLLAQAQAIAARG
ncbi:CoA ester lyase [Orrella sp. JC864]|uniref:HpcH/HpaI aldolase/citrate lyase family protein n=1 Tax=Orrella sp. JC864 TaxID=3120298 RepID=UPI0012BC954B